jgi:biopolymer transport protein ExbD
MSRARPLKHRGALRRWELRFGPNMTPMVDVVMVILIFFMAATALLGPEWFLRTALPAYRGGSAPGGDPFALPPARFDIRLTRDEEGRTVATGLGGAPLGLDDLDAELAALGADASGSPGEDTGSGGGVLVLISAAAEVPYRDVVRVHDACTRAGITQVGLDLQR